MEKYCVSLKIAKKLKLAGWDKETEFIYSNGCLLYKNKLLSNKNVYYMPTAIELFNIMPRKIDDYFLVIYKLTYNESEVIYEKNYPQYDFKYRFLNKNLSDALALMWIWLKENGYIK